ncbi:triphosphoribosyl-dephospho-CoA synthase [Aurantimonas sp. VKM B-3413]|uniref:triphosphoribosyl-dephospho-CoA synthase n=1 Tax=Aurantimonas sp. VKM B-3413 TaxID=2779401 RepID=UPI001E4F5CA2|nr:triphosphoribosyl-dephospho-CoA synthase [Aurantimonas sp. VKM B-3413]MCB8838228.1 triphosphoribosyl-dephospho-CoA synthase [Aurantimonas sp. VKM B-3413]
MTVDAKAVADAFVAACEAELDVVKPGNVHRFAPGHGMDAALFVASAVASAPFVAAPGMPVGERILKATEASWQAAGMNTNLGIVLLAAPLAAAAERLDAARPSPAASPAALQGAVKAVLADLTAEDARDAFAAIARASPGGLGDRNSHDVRDAPTISLVEAMSLAADRDLVARQYRDGFEGVFAIGLPALDQAPWESEPFEGLGSALHCYLAFAATFPDSHILRKYGLDQAEAVRRRFTEFSKRLSAIGDSRQAVATALAFDDELKRSRLNPGTSADLTVASLFAKSLAEPDTG